MKGVSELAAGAARIAASEFDALARTLERLSREGDTASTAGKEVLVGQLGAAFEIVAGQVEQVRVLRAQLDRLSGRGKP